MSDEGEYDAFAELAKDLDREFYVPKTKELAKIANISIKLSEYDIGQEPGEDYGEDNSEEFKEEKARVFGTYTLADMRAWFKLLGDGAPYHTILYFGHGKSRAIGEGWSGGKFVDNVAHAAERAFVRLLGEEKYQQYMKDLMQEGQQIQQPKVAAPQMQAPKVELKITRHPTLSIPKKVEAPRIEAMPQIAIPLPEKAKVKKKHVEDKEEEKERLKA